jgi:hypothetical protein
MQLKIYDIVNTHGTDCSSIRTVVDKMASLVTFKTHIGWRGSSCWILLLVTENRKVIHHIVFLKIR